MTADQRQKAADWLLWFSSNRPRHEGSADIARQQEFTMKALDGVFILLSHLYAADAREEQQMLVRLVRR